MLVQRCEGAGWSLAVSGGLQGFCTGVYSGVKWCTVVYSGLQWCTVVYSGLQWFTVVLSGLQWFTVVYSGVQRFTGVSRRGVQWCMCGFIQPFMPLVNRKTFYHHQ